LDSTIESLHECQDIFISDLGKLETLRWRIADLLSLEWNRKTYRYIRKSK
jgi:hypothetical protein